MKNVINLFVLTAICLSLSSCFGCDGCSKRYVDEVEVSDSLEFTYGEGYTSPDGGSQIYYQGSREQKRDLEMIDEYFNEHGWD